MKTTRYLATSKTTNIHVETYFVNTDTNHSNLSETLQINDTTDGDTKSSEQPLELDSHGRRIKPVILLTKDQTQSNLLTKRNIHVVHMYCIVH